MAGVIRGSRFLSALKKVFNATRRAVSEARITRLAVSAPGYLRRLWRGSTVGILVSTAALDAGLKRRSEPPSLVVDSVAFRSILRAVGWGMRYLKPAWGRSLSVEYAMGEQTIAPRFVEPALVVAFVTNTALLWSGGLASSLQVGVRLLGFAVAGLWLYGRWRRRRLRSRSRGRKRTSD